MKNLIDETGGRKMFTFSEQGHEDDYFLTRDDMSESHWEMLMRCHHEGSCDDDASEAAKYFQFPSEEATLKAAKYIVECGIEQDRFFQDDECELTWENLNDEDAVMLYYLWTLSADLQEKGDD
jgi:hypothetical protein